MITNTIKRYLLVTLFGAVSLFSMYWEIFAYNRLSSHELAIGIKSITFFLLVVLGFIGFMKHKNDTVQAALILMFYCLSVMVAVFW